MCGATAVQVADEVTGRTCTATVVDTDATDDVAVRQLKNATGLQAGVHAIGKKIVEEVTTSPAARQRPATET